MVRHNRKVQVRVDTYTRVCLTAIAVLLTVLIAGLWAEGVPTSQTASAGSPATGREVNKPYWDSAGQRDAMVKEMQQVNRKLDELKALLKSGEAKFTVVGGDGGKNEEPPKRK